ncbi:MAG: hypothetical protein ACKO24_09680 [Leptolyngbyaceae cyanobacterium]
MTQITIDIPDDLAQRLQQFQSQLPQVLDLGLQELETQQRSANFLDEQDIIMSTYVSAALRKQVIERAKNRCEYYRSPLFLTLEFRPGRITSPYQTLPSFPKPQKAESLS